MTFAPDTLHCQTIRHGSPEYIDAVALRDEILRKPLGLVLTEEQMRAEYADHHLACFLNGQTVACLVLTAQDDGTVRMRQVAVTPACQRQGIGTTLVRYAEQFAADHGYREITAHARDTAVPFYERLGYEVKGTQFTEVGIPHVTVRKLLRLP